MDHCRWSTEPARVISLETENCRGIAGRLTVRNTRFEIRLQAVTNVADRNQSALERRQFRAQARDVDVNRPVVAVVRVRPDIRQHLRACDDAPGVLEEIAKEQHLARRQRNGLAGFGDGHASGVERQIAQVDQAGGFLHRDLDGRRKHSVQEVVHLDHQCREPLLSGLGGATV